MAPPDGHLSDPLAQLARMAGPETAGELLQRLGEDLEAVRAGLRAAAGDPGGIADLAALGRHSHVLIALAGTAGDSGLQGQAQDLNRRVQGGQGADAPELAPLLAGIERDLAALIARVGVAARGAVP